MANPFKRYLAFMVSTNMLMLTLLSILFKHNTPLIFQYCSNNETTYLSNIISNIFIQMINQ